MYFEVKYILNNVNKLKKNYNCYKQDSKIIVSIKY